jgi:hypothetical protein
MKIDWTFEKAWKREGHNFHGERNDLILKLLDEYKTQNNTGGLFPTFEDVQKQWEAHDELQDSIELAVCEIGKYMTSKDDVYIDHAYFYLVQAMAILNERKEDSVK